MNILKKGIKRYKKYKKEEPQRQTKEIARLKKRKEQAELRSEIDSFKAKSRKSKEVGRPKSAGILGTGLHFDPHGGEDFLFGERKGKKKRDRYRKSHLGSLGR